MIGSETFSMVVGLNLYFVSVTLSCLFSLFGRVRITPLSPKHAALGWAACCPPLLSPAPWAWHAFILLE